MTSVTIGSIWSPWKRFFQGKTAWNIRPVSQKRACPPEDSGALWGYYDVLEIFKRPKHSEYTDTVEWIGDEHFDPEEVSFNDPQQELKGRGIQN
ncbi:MAG: plasmid pRiA4b ORF-3 family protein [Candidatus Moranbacteria bacterium]|nr:plasmid pRiA4b ORF-3 family protein [Candidatus Moranbacteria bacterium]